VLIGFAMQGVAGVEHLVHVERLLKQGNREEKLRKHGTDPFQL
jgi:hypothetical protein